MVVDSLSGVAQNRYVFIDLSPCHYASWAWYDIMSLTWTKSLVLPSLADDRFDMGACFNRSILLLSPSSRLQPKAILDRGSIVWEE